ncbi:MAG: alpha-1,2-fucosyltransferase [Pirellulaceae bacterium]|nr:MAG: alpha-1,2-fucosyltransferase [Pirellulaceae bacterium]
MIVVRVEGGLGNQMFQYAFGWWLARKHATTLYLDLTAYDHAPAHGYLLDRFAIEATPLPPELHARLPRRYRKDGTTARTSLFSRSPKPLRRVKEKPFGFAARYLAAKDDSYLVGYWQSERYFASQQEALRRQFTLRSKLSQQSERIRQQMLSSCSLALHVRRGDYVDDPQAARIYARQTIDYYHRAVAHFARQRSEPIRVFVFSNDIAWCREYLRFPWPTHWVDHTTAATAVEDMILMSCARSLVMANSTFSWWAAWLGEHRGQQIYAPSAWFLPGTLDDRHILPSRWTRIESTCKKAA